MKDLKQQMSHVLTSAGGYCSWGRCDPRANRTHTIFPGSREDEGGRERRVTEGRGRREGKGATPKDFLKEFTTTLELRMTDYILAEAEH